MKEVSADEERGHERLPEPYQTTGGPPKTHFDESIFYITGTRKDGLSRFHRFLVEGKGWSLNEIDFYLAAMADRWPPTEYPLMINLFPIYEHLVAAALNPSPFVKRLLNHPASISLIQAYGIGRSDRWLDYGGFVRADLPVLREVYSAWWKRQLALARTENLPRKKKNIPNVEKIA
jgi:hypothetical protein